MDLVKCSNLGRVSFVRFEDADGESSTLLLNTFPRSKLTTLLLLKRFLRGRGVANSPVSDVLEDTPRKENSVPNGERGVTGFPVVDGVSAPL